MCKILKTLFTCPVIIPPFYPTDDIALWGTKIRRINLNVALIVHKEGEYERQN